MIGSDGHGRRALLLPGIEGLDTVESQLEALREKAGVDAGAPFSIERFEVDKFEERT